MDIKKIVITGGPCGGKSTALDFVRQALSRKGYTVLPLAETATELITGGVAPWTCANAKAFQTCQLQLQLKKEQVFEEAARTMDAEQILLLCDRGALDNKAYLSDDDYSTMLTELHLTESELRDRYDGVFHLVSAAIGACDEYTTANNSARTETPEQAAQLDERIALAWQNHPRYFRIETQADFQEKLNLLVEQIESFLNIT